MGQFVTRNELDGAIRETEDGLRVEIRSGDELVVVKLDGVVEVINERFKSLKLWGSLALVTGSALGTAFAARFGASGPTSALHQILHHII